MRIESLIRITGGVLLNTPSVDSINDIKTNDTKNSVLKSKVILSIFSVFCRFCLFTSTIYPL